MSESMLIIIVIFSLVHASFFIWLTVQWGRIKEVNLSSNERKASVIIPIRNEENKISQLIKSLEHQDYPADQFEVIFINDHSDDGTEREVMNQMKSSELMIRLVALEDGQQGKKKAATAGVKASKYDAIICTDADCNHSPIWLSTMMATMSSGFNMISAPVRIRPDNWFTRIQSLEFSGLIAFGGIMLNNGMPGMCNGANMAYRKEAFRAVGGYEGNFDIPTGDDEFLLQKISRLKDGETSFLKSSGAIVETDGKNTFKELWAQRVRWTSKWRFHKSTHIKVSAFVTFSDFLVGIFSIPFLMITDQTIWLLLLLVRWIPEWIYLNRISTFLGIRSGWSAYLVLSIFYPIYAVILGIASIFGRYSWKGRAYIYE